MKKKKLEELGRLDVEAFKKTTKIPIVLVLDNIRSLNNIGSIFRTADAFRVEKIFLCGITAQPPHRDITKTALGATDSVDWEYFEYSTKACSYLRKNGFNIIAIEQAEGSQELSQSNWEINKKYALVFGHEVNGVSDEVMTLVDQCIEIPQFGTKHSFNISVSAGIVLWDLYVKCFNKILK